MGEWPAACVSRFRSRIRDTSNSFLLKVRTKQDHVGSNPIPQSNSWCVGSSIGRAVDCGSTGCRFKPGPTPQNFFERRKENEACQKNWQFFDFYPCFLVAKTTSAKAISTNAPAM